MHEGTSRQAGDRPGTTVASGAIAMAGALTMASTMPTLLDLARVSHGAESLIAQVLLALAGLGALLCLYLALIWGLAAAILLAGPASRLGSSLLGVLRILAPRLARRLAGGAAIATAATALALGPALATHGITAPESERREIAMLESTAHDTASESAPSLQSSRLVSAELPTADTDTPPADPSAPAEPAPTEPAPEAAGPGGTVPVGGGSGTAPLPSLGWNGGPAASPPADDADADAALAPSAPAGTSAGAERPAPAGELPQLVVVEHGDSLWSISAELLGPEVSDPADIARAWPLLHETNQDLIGEDPGLLLPGQELVIPSALIPEDAS